LTSEDSHDNLALCSDYKSVGYSSANCPDAQSQSSFWCHQNLEVYNKITILGNISAYSLWKYIWRLLCWNT